MHGECIEAEGGRINIAIGLSAAACPVSNECLISAIAGRLEGWVTAITVCFVLSTTKTCLWVLIMASPF